MKKRYWAAAAMVLGMFVGGVNTFAAIPKDVITYNGHSYRYYEYVTTVEPVDEKGEGLFDYRARSGSDSNGNKTYYYGTLTWEQAKAECEKLGGHLITIADSGENQTAIDCIRKAIGDGRVAGVSKDMAEADKEDFYVDVYPYIGAHDFDGDGKWEWVTGEAIKGISTDDLLDTTRYANWWRGYLSAGDPFRSDKEKLEWRDYSSAKVFSDVGSAFYDYFAYMAAADTDKAGQIEATGEWHTAPSNNLNYNDETYKYYLTDAHERYKCTGFLCEWDFQETTAESKTADDTTKAADDTTKAADETTKSSNTATKEQTKTPPKKGETFTLGGFTYKVTRFNSSANRGEVSVKKQTKKSVTMIIDASVKYKGGTYDVTAIGDKAFQKNTKVKRVMMNNVKTIGKSAFQGCKKLESVSASPDLVQIGNSAFSGCKKLSYVDFFRAPSNSKYKLKKIGANAFYGCTALKYADIPAKVSSIGKSAFQGCKNLADINIKTEKLTTRNVGASAFKGISAKARVKVPKKKLAAYKKWLVKKGLPKKAEIK